MGAMCSKGRPTPAMCGYSSALSMRYSRSEDNANNDREYRQAKRDFGRARVLRGLVCTSRLPASRKIRKTALMVTLGVVKLSRRTKFASKVQLSINLPL